MKYIEVSPHYFDKITIFNIRTLVIRSWIDVHDEYAWYKN